MKTSELTAEAIIQAIEKSKATSLGQLHRAMGGKGSVPGSLAKRLKVLVPNIGDLIAANKKASGEPEPTKQANEGKAPKRTAKKSGDKPSKRAVKRADSNPFRDGSGYGLLYDILAAAGADGLSVDSLRKRYMEITGKDADHTRYDVCVILSAKDSPTGPRHRSCREGFWVDRENDHAVLRLA